MAQEAKEMLKHSLSLQQMKEQTQQSKMSLKEQEKCLKGYTDN